MEPPAPHDQIAALHRLYGATRAYCEELGRGQLAAVRLAEIDDELDARDLLRNIEAALDEVGADLGTPVRIKHILAEMLASRGLSSISKNVSTTS